MVWRDGIQILGGEETMLREFALIPTASLNPLSRWQLFCPFGNCFLHIFDALYMRITQIEDIRSIELTWAEVSMGIQ